MTTTTTRQHADSQGLIAEPAPHRPAKPTDCHDRADAVHRAALAAEGLATRWDTTPVSAVVRGGCGRPTCEARPTRGGSCLCQMTARSWTALRARALKAGRR